jgi:plasmid stabilization system protein ParE
MIRWTKKARQHLERLHAFMEPIDARAAVRLVDSLLTGVERLAEFPRLGQRLTRYGRREVRRVHFGDYEVRYELTSSSLIILRLWHTREDR